MSMESAFDGIEAHYAAELQKHTFGHLAPKKNKTYKGHVVWALGCFGDDDLNPTAIEAEFEGLSSSPWFYSCLIDFMANHSREAGSVFRFDGTFRNFEFNGKIRRVRLV